ncbi:Uncharacterised protein [Vibrio cholerae]|nr:Uncharacterised protein [Vibrio cholerae]
MANRRYIRSLNAMQALSHLSHIKVVLADRYRAR